MSSESVVCSSPCSPSVWSVDEPNSSSERPAVASLNSSLQLSTLPILVQYPPVKSSLPCLQSTTSSIAPPSLRTPGLSARNSHLNVSDPTPLVSALPLTFYWLGPS